MVLGHAFSQPLANLPPFCQISHLVLGNSFTSPIPFGNLPHLEWLALGDCYPYKPMPQFPPTLKTLAWRQSNLGNLSVFTSITTLVTVKQTPYGEYPPYVKHLVLSDLHLTPLISHDNGLGKLSKVTHLHLNSFVSDFRTGSYYAKQGDTLPPNLTHLHLDNAGATGTIKGGTIKWLCIDICTPSLSIDLPALTHFSCRELAHEIGPRVFEGQCSPTHIALALPYGIDNKGQQLEARLLNSVTDLRLIGKGRDTDMYILSLPSKLKHLDVSMRHKPGGVDVLPNVLQKVNFSHRIPFEHVSSLRGITVLPTRSSDKSIWGTFCL